VKYWYIWKILKALRGAWSQPTRSLHKLCFKCTACIYGWFLFSQFSFAWCRFCIVGHFEWFSKSSLTHSSNTIIIFAPECICIFDKSIKQWLISPLWEVPVGTLSRHSMHLSHSVNRVRSQLQPKLGYMQPSFLKYATKVKLSTGAWRQIIRPLHKL
jgi:hypothetical protein